MPMTQPLRVAYVVKRYPRYSETFILNEILAHEAAGLDMEIFALGFPFESHFQNLISKVRAPVNYLIADGLKITDFWRAFGEAAELLPGLWNNLEIAQHEEARYLYQALLLAKAIQERQINHLHAHFGTAATTVARLAARFAGIEYTFTAHAKDIFHEDVDREELQRKMADAAGVVTVSEFNMHFLQEQFGEAANQVTRIYNGLDVETFPFEAPDNCPTPVPEVIGVGRLIEKKSFGDLIEACALLAAKGRRFSCRIVGEGELKTELHAQIERLHLQNCVVLTGPRPQEEIIEYLRCATVFAAPCVVGEDGNRDGLPTVLLEAMALGTPCVSTDVTGIPEVVRDNVTGLIVPQHAPVALAEALQRLFDDHELRLRLAHAARRLIEAEFDIHRNTACQRELFQAATHGSCKENGCDSRKDSRKESPKLLAGTT